MSSYKEIVNIDSSKRFGKPCIPNTRISVYDVLAWLAKGMSKEEIVNDYPELTEQDIVACLAFAAEREHNARVA